MSHLSYPIAMQAQEKAQAQAQAPCKAHLTEVSLRLVAGLVQVALDNVFGDTGVLCLCQNGSQTSIGGGVWPTSLGLLIPDP